MMFLNCTLQAQLRNFGYVELQQTGQGMGLWHHVGT